MFEKIEAFIKPLGFRTLPLSHPGEEVSLYAEGDWIVDIYSTTTGGHLSVYHPVGKLILQLRFSPKGISSGDPYIEGLDGLILFKLLMHEFPEFQKPRLYDFFERLKSMVH